jgi:thioredoxin reductase (NADPH)
MLTRDEVRAVPLFAKLSDADLDRLVRTSADIHLNPGEHAVHEGGERALYAVLSGKIEVVKRFDGVERTLGWRLPGTIFGEVPLAFATPFPGGYRAAEPSRVMRVEPHHYFAIASSAPEVAEKVGALARERIGGLQGIAMQPPKAQITVYGERWDPVCGEVRRFLSRNQMVHDWLSPETPDLARSWTGSLPEATDCPVVRLPDGTLVHKPTLRDLAVRLGLQTRPDKDLYDTLIIGGGPAELAAAVYGASEGLRTLVIEREAPGGQAGTSSRIENYLGFPNGVSGDELASRALQQARRLGAEIVVTRSVESMDPATREVVLDGGERVRAHSVIVATGVSWRRLVIEGFEPLIGKGIYYGASRSEAAVRLSPIKRVAAAVGEGSMAIAFVHQYLAREGVRRQR